MVRLALLVAVATCAFGLAVAFPNAGVISPSLLKKLTDKKTASVAISLKSGVQSIYDQASTKTYTFRGQRMTDVREQLIQHTTKTQKSITSFLDSQDVSYTTFWITNRIIVKNANFDLVQQLAANPEVSEIREEIVLPVPTVKKTPISSRQEPIVRGVHIVRSKVLWEQGFSGQGMITSNIDTGVRGTHEVLRDNYMGQYGWFDPSFRTPQPNDNNGHGTHTMGTIAGRSGFGVAPNSTWMACKGCATNSCAESDLIGCGQFIACPTMADGTAPDCTKAPHVVGNSWGSTLGGQNWYDDVISGWHMAEVIPVFSAGNAGSSCSSVGSPGDRDVIGVAATDMDDVIAYFSSRGPSAGNPVKPEISAPGVQVLSSTSDGDDTYAKYDGTSMASPHVTGGVALLIQKNPALAGNYQAIRTVLFEGAQQEGLVGSSQQCGGIDDRTFPNNVFGYGRLDLDKSSQVAFP